MKKSLIALATLCAFAGAASAQSSVTLYGIIDLGIVKQNEADTTFSLGGVGLQNEELNVAQATKSRIGFRGVEDLGGGLTAKFDIEHRFTPDNGGQNGASFWDKSIVGLAGGFGEVTLGRDYMPAFYPQYLLDPWLNQGIAEVGGTTYAWAGYISPVTGLGARYNNGIYYRTPNLNGFTAMVAASLSEADGVDNRYGLNVMYNAGPLFIAGAYDQSPTAPATGVDETNSVIFIGAAYDFGFVKPRLSVARSELNIAPGVEINPTSVTLAATFPIGTNLVKAGYTQIEWDDAIGGGDETKQRKFSLGYELNLSKRTAIYTDLTSGKTKGEKTVTGVDVGVRHLF